MAQAGDFPAVPRDEPVYLICERGQISELVGLYLKEAGFGEVYNVEGGMLAWRQLKETN
jgi:rhodanese-related sulfurtransferase